MIIVYFVCVLFLLLFILGIDLVILSYLWGHSTPHKPNERISIENLLHDSRNGRKYDNFSCILDNFFENCICLNNEMSTFTIYNEQHI